MATSKAQPGTRAGRYVYVPYPWRAAVDVSSRAPARHYVRLVLEGLRQPAPSPGARRFAERVVRRRAPEGAAAGLIRALPRRSDPELDELGRDLVGAWRSLDHAPPGPEHPALGKLSLLALERSAGRTVFAFNDLPTPVVVLKLPRPGQGSLLNEVSALREAQGVPIAPRYLGTAGRAHVQEAIDGAPLTVRPAHPGHLERFVWPPALSRLAEAFAGLASHTVKPGRPEELDLPIRLAFEKGGLSESAQRRLREAWSSLDDFALSVLRHGDTSPQNCLYGSDGRLAGVVDWEDAWSHAAPGFDVWNAALAYLERGVAATGWSQQGVVDAFRAVRGESRYWGAASSAGRATAAAAGATEDDLDALEIAFFGHRLIERLQAPGDLPTTPRTAARMLEIVCDGFDLPDRSRQ